MKLRKIIQGEEMEQLLKLYVEAFPPEERRPVEQMPPDDRAFTFYAVGDVGLLTAWEFDGYTYVEHFAVYPDKRGNGVGSQALAALSNPVILEVEPPESGEMARRRIAFYERNGFRLVDYDYMQPAYSPEFSAIPMKLMIRGDLPCSVAEVVQTLLLRVYGCSDK